MSCTVQKTLVNIPHPGFYPKITFDYLNGEEKLKSFYRYAPALSSFKNVIEDFRKATFDRKLLAEVLSEQYSSIGLRPPDSGLLADENTFTVCTGHQLCLFTGPLYFIYKIISTINLSEKLRENFPGYHFVPVYWMASEDHDFEEINHIHLFGKKIEWRPGTRSASEPEDGMKTEDHLWNKGKIPAGKISTDSIDEVMDELKIILGENENAKQLLKLFSEAYLKHENLADATRFLIHRLFGKYGLVIIDGNERRLKQIFSPVIKDDLFNHTASKLVSETISGLTGLSYHHQVNPREINLFLLEENERRRIESSEVHAEKEKWKKKSEDEIERFSPNVVLRPLYQQKILPNIAYVGGPGEIAYWLEYKKMFGYHNISFPVLMLRNSILWIDPKASAQMKKLDISETEILEDTVLLANKFIHKNSGKEIDLNSEKENLKAIFNSISGKTEKTDLSLKPSVEAELQRTLHSLEHLEKKMLKAEKQKNEVALHQIKKLKEKLFPGNTLQERYDNFIPYYLECGEEFLKILKENIDPFENRLLILRAKHQ